MSVEVFARTIKLAPLECIDVQYEVLRKFQPEIQQLKYVGVRDPCQLAEKLWNELMAEKDKDYISKASTVYESVKQYTETEKALMSFGLTKYWYTVFYTKNNGD